MESKRITDNKMIPYYFAILTLILMLISLMIVVVYDLKSPNHNNGITDLFFRGIISMGGLIGLITIFLSSVFWNRFENNKYLISLILVIIGFMLIVGTIYVMISSY